VLVHATPYFLVFNIVAYILQVSGYQTDMMNTIVNKHENKELNIVGSREFMSRCGGAAGSFAPQTVRRRISVTRTSHMPVPSTPHHQIYQLRPPLALHHCTKAHCSRQLLNSYDCINSTRWRPRRNIRTFHNATASRKQATANRLPHTRPNLSLETPDLRMTMCPMTSRYAH
jgi:hypothetical protein